jgi:hypothetical protein
LSAVDAIEIDQAAWTTYLQTLRMPEDVSIGADGFCFRQILRDGQITRCGCVRTAGARFRGMSSIPFGLTSPESDGAAARCRR